MSTDLSSVLPVPSEPETPVPFEKWPEIEQQLGSALPSDYKRYMSAYGNGIIADFLIVYNPLSSRSAFNLLKRVDYSSEDLRGFRDMFPEDYPHPIFPESEGLLIFGRTVNGDEMFWKTKGDPDEWEIWIFEVRQVVYDVYPMNMTTFIKQYIEGQFIGRGFLHPPDTTASNLFVPIKV